MARIEDSQGRRPGQPPSGYTRVFGIDALGQLMSRIQSATIKAGLELEQMVLKRCQNPIPDLDAFLADNTQKDGVFVASKKVLKASRTVNLQAIEPDFLVFKHDGGKRHCYVLELKDGDQFDTKKAAGERDSLNRSADELARAVPYTTNIKMCCFNVATREDIVVGMKRKFKKDEVMTGKELCELLGIDYDEFVRVRTNDQQRNLDTFVKELLAIPRIKKLISKMLRNP